MHADMQYCAYRGGTLNVECTAPKMIYSNKELRGLILAWELGTRGLKLEERALRYRKIFIMTYVDVDGSRIRVMLLMFFFWH